MAKKLIATKAILVDVGDGHVALEPGQEVDPDSLPAGAVEAMVRLNELVDPGFLEEQAKAQEEAAAATHEKAASDKLSTPVGELGLEDRVVTALGAAGLATVDDVLKFGKANKGLQKIDGIGEASEKEIKAAVEELLA